MCGFSGFISPGHSSQVATHDLKVMSQSIIHRGPDDRGHWLDERAGVGLSHRRLSVVDLSPAGHQPMHSACGRYVIAFNGEIYNHRDLRARLESAGVAPAWRGHADTETLLACFVAWGIEKTLQATVGMFAIALWDRQERVLTLARDRLGEKPLYWGWQDGVLLFGSELKALKAHPACKAEIDRDALALLLRYNYIPAPSSIYKGIEKLRPGHYVSIPLNVDAAVSVQSIPYWQMNQAVEQGQVNLFTGSDAEAVDLLEQQLSQSIAGQMLADVPLGAFLSGGVDSSSVVALMQRQSSQPVRTFAIGFNETGYNEAEHALAVARHLGTDHTELYVSSADALAVVPRLSQMYCEPFADSSQIPTFLVSQMARQHVTVALSGDAGDELFGGYNPYQFAPRIWKHLSKLPVSVRKLAASTLSGLPMPGKVRKLMEVLPAASREDFYHLLMSHWKQPEALVIAAHEPLTQLSSPQAWPVTENFANWMMAMDAQTYMTDDILVKVDRAAMANSLETRVPMLDHRVVELAWRIPVSLKIREGKGKWVLREMLYRHVPRELIDRPKKGFSIPLAIWLRGSLRGWAEALLDESRLQREGYFNAAPVRRVWLEHLHSKADHSTKLWSILMFQAWLEEQKL
ncbi:asparagine synthase (glutamine-hydrolyzing) [Pseudomonas sp. MBLB4123]|uniref:asparagine synthase (glutamine-hydrolyzing) n=1 Tax=Pseudomonas sp. MBLB4123 TaxID=3451557 RepID=UPI003F74E6C4